MTRVSPLRATLATGLALGTAALSVALAPAALAATTLPAVSVSPSTTVAAGADFTISGTGCVRDVAGQPTEAVITEAVDSQWGEAEEAAVDGTWSMTFTAPAEAGTYEFALWCDRYHDELDYPNLTITVTANSTPAPAPTPAAPVVTGVKGVAANTPGVAPTGSTSATNDKVAAPGEKVVRVLKGFQPFEVVAVTLHSTPQTVGTFTANAEGVLTVEFTVPAGTPVGKDHTLVYNGTVTYYQESFEVAGATSSAASLAYTGSSVALPLSLGAGLLAVGGGVLLVTRRRSNGASQA